MLLVPDPESGTKNLRKLAWQSRTQKLQSLVNTPCSSRLLSFGPEGYRAQPHRGEMLWRERLPFFSARWTRVVYIAQSTQAWGSALSFFSPSSPSFLRTWTPGKGGCDGMQCDGKMLRAGPGYHPCTPAASSGWQAEPSAEPGPSRVQRGLDLRVGNLHGDASPRRLAIHLDCCVSEPPR